MAIGKFYASDFGLQVSTDGSTYTTVSGINNLVYTEEGTDIDATDFDADGWTSMVPGNKSGQVEVEGFRLADTTTYVRDEGQKMVEKAARQRGYLGLRDYKIVLKASPSTDYMHFQAFAKNGDFGGGNDELTPWNVTLMFDGAPDFHGPFFDPDDES